MKTLYSVRGRSFSTSPVNLMPLMTWMSPWGKREEFHYRSSSFQKLPKTVRMIIMYSIGAPSSKHRYSMNLTTRISEKGGAKYSSF
jgi:hypothetical protein